MAARFGRNQRRKMRDALTEKDRQISVMNEMLTEAMNRSAACGREVASLRQRLEAWARDVMHLMGEDSAFNERVRRMTIDERYAGAGQLEFAPIVDLSPVSRSMKASATPITVRTVITALIWRLHMSRDEFRPMIRIELENRFKQPVGYALSPEHRWTPRDAEYLSRRIADEMVTHLNATPSAKGTEA